MFELADMAASMVLDKIEKGQPQSQQKFDRLRRCQATNKSGWRCARPAVFGQKVCCAHKFHFDALNERMKPPPQE